MAARMKKAKRALSSEKADESRLNDKIELPPTIRSSDEPVTKKSKWTNKQRVLTFASRGIIFRGRHLLVNLRSLLPHTKYESKMEKNQRLTMANEICEMRNCNKCLYVESKKKKDLYLWMSNVPNGPSAKFLVENMHTMEELRMTGNCLQGSRAILSFDEKFDSEPCYALLKELFAQIFGTPHQHPKSQPFVDHVINFSILDGRIWFRNYQICEEDGSLAEIGPRFALNPIRIFEGSFNGAVLWENTDYLSPNLHRSNMKKVASSKYLEKIQARVVHEVTAPKVVFRADPTDEVFQSSVPPVFAEEAPKKPAARKKAEKKKKDKKNFLRDRIKHNQNRKLKKY